MSTRELAAQVFDLLNDAQLRDFMLLFADDNSLARFESELMGHNKDFGKTYNNFKEVIADLDAESAEEDDDI